MTTKEAYERAKALAQRGDYEAALQALIGYEHPKIEALRQQIREAAGTRKPKQEVTSEAVAAGIKQAKADEKQAKAKQQGLALIISLVLIFACCGWISYLGQQPIGQNDASRQQIEIMSTIRGVTDVDVRSVNVVHREDGYSGIIIAYNSQGDFYSEYGAIFGAVGSLIRRQGWQFDDLALVVGDRNGNALHTVGVQMSDILAFLDGTISIETFSERMTITDF